MNSEQINRKTATFAAGCFWCVEAVFQQLKGVEKVVSGYMGGHTKKPSYEDICTGMTGHAEVIQITYSLSKIQFKDLLEVFFKTHDPTSLNRQGNDVGTQYRSAVFYGDLEQKALTENAITELENAGAYPSKIVTTLEVEQVFYPAEDYHQNYFIDKGNKNPYCAMVVKPKVEKFQKVFKDLLK